MDFEKIKDKINPAVDVEVTQIQTIYEGNSNVMGLLTTKKCYDVATAQFPSSKRQIYIIDRFNRMKRGHNKVTLEIVSNPLNELKNIREWYPRLKESRGNDFIPITDPNYADLWYVVPTIHPQDFFPNCGAWKENLVQLFYQGHLKDERIVATFKCCMPPLPFNPKKYQRFNNHVFLFTQTKTGKTGFSHEVLGQYVVTEPSVAGLAGGILGKTVQIGALQGTGFCMLDEINATNTEVFDLILNIMEQGIGTRGKVGQPSCMTTKTIMFAGNPEDDVPELLAMDFRAILSTLTKEGANVERVSGRLGLFVYGIDYKKVKPFEIADPDEIDIIRGVIYDTLSLEQDKFEKLIDRLAPTWLFLEDSDWEDKIKSLAPKAKDDKIYQFISGWKNSVDNMRMASLRWALIDNLDKFALQELDTFISDEFLKDLENKYLYIRDEINFKSLERLTKVDFRVTYEKFKEMIVSHPALKTKPERQLQRLFGLGSHNTIRKWLETVDSEMVRETEFEDREMKAETIDQHEIDKAMTELNKTKPKRPNFNYE